MKTDTVFRRCIGPSLAKPQNWTQIQSSRFPAEISAACLLKKPVSFSFLSQQEAYERYSSGSLCLPVPFPLKNYTANFIDRDPHCVSKTNSTSDAPLFQKGAYAMLHSDVSMGGSRPSLLLFRRNQKGNQLKHFLLDHRNTTDTSHGHITCYRHGFIDKEQPPISSPSLVPSISSSQTASSLLRTFHNNNNSNSNLLGDAVMMDLSCRWSAKFYGQVTFGPRGFAYPSSRWLARRFRMKKHKILKRFRFRRYKLAAIANLPFAKMIRVGMLPELKSSKTRKGDAVDLDLSTQLVQQARSSTGGKVKGRRSRPKSKYQV